MAKKRPQRRDSAPGSDVSAILGIEKEKTYQERKLEYDRNRVRLRVDVPTWLKDAIEEEADGQRVSMSQLSAFFRVSLNSWVSRVQRALPDGSC